jgi:hypothetical protein
VGEGVFPSSRGGLGRTRIRYRVMSAGSHAEGRISCGKRAFQSWIVFTLGY